MWQVHEFVRWKNTEWHLLADDKMVRDNRSQKNTQLWLRLFCIMLINNKKAVHNFSSADSLKAMI
jgi:hypothetical protein